MHRILPAAVFAFVAFSACWSPAPSAVTDVTLTIAPERPRPGSTVTLTLRNGSDEPVGYNLCTSTLTQRTGDSWSPVESDRICTLELRMLQPGQADSFRLDLPRDLPDGTFRFHTRLERNRPGAPDEVATPPFEIAG